MTPPTKTPKDEGPAGGDRTFAFTSGPHEADQKTESNVL